MSIFIPVAILIVATLIQAFMQLTPGVFALFYHYTLGKNSSTKADDLSLHFILGVITFIIIAWLLVYALIFAIFYDKVEPYPNFLPWLMAGIFLAESIASLLFYYRKGKFTALFIPRSIAKNLDFHAQKVKNRSDAFVLGFFSGIPELIFTLPLYAISAIELMRMNFPLRPIFIIIYVIATIIPLFVIRTLYRHDHTLAKIEHTRIRAKLFIRILLCIGFLLLALSAIKLGVFNHG